VSSEQAAPMTRLTSVLDTEDIPAGMVLRVFDLAGGERPAAPVEVSHWSLEPGADSGDDQHAVRELWLIAAGRGVMTCGGKRLDVAAGEVISIEPNQPHRLVTVGHEAVEVFSVWWSD
jgi:mannose-6-phosphate isomerase-like protein (cupin superfamily)